MLRSLLKLLRDTSRRGSVPRWTPLAVRRLAGSASEVLSRMHQVRSANQALAGRVANLDDAEVYLQAHAIPLKAPLVIISQVQRSGGTLLSQLFDGHPELGAYPQELKFDFPVADSWPQLDSKRGADWNFRKLFDPNFPQKVRRGFTKGDLRVRYGFMLMSRVQYRLFIHGFQKSKPENAREILNLFFTAFFNAWLNYQGNLRQKRWLTAFAPRWAHHDQNVERFFADYPDGRLIQILRDPKTWYPSARHHTKSAMSGKGAEHILDKWCVSAQSMLRNRARFGDKVTIVRFEDLVADTESTMRALADRLAIGWDPSLLNPTFNSELMRANSSFAIERSGVVQEPLKREGLLSDEERKLIMDRCTPLYTSVVGEAYKCCR